MTVEEVGAIFRRYMDEPDQTFVDDAQMAIWLSMAYNDFRTIANSTDPYLYSKSVPLTLTNSRIQSLQGIILGAGAPAEFRMYQLRDLWWVTAGDTNHATGRLKPGTSEELVDGRCDYVLISDSIVFNIERSGTMMINYIPEQNVNWVDGVTDPTVYVDDLNRFHDLIALIAYLQYAILDAAESPQLVALLIRRQAQLRAYLEGRSGGIIEHVADVEYV